MAKLNGKWVQDTTIGYGKLNLSDGDIPQAKITDLTTDLAAKADLVAGKVPASQLPSAIMEYQGTWDADQNSPALADGAGNADEAIGNVYRVTVAGSQDLGSGSISFEIGDYVILNSTKVWEKSDTTDAVASVNGQVGVVVLDADDIDDTSTTNKFVTAADVTKLGNISVTQAVDLDTMESDIGTNASNFSDHVDGTASKHDASEIDVEATDGNYHGAEDLETVIGKLDQQIKDNADAIGTVAVPTNNKEEFTLDGTDISNGYVDLAQTPIVASLHVVPDGAVPQRAGVDYTVSTNRITFTGDMASVLESGDVLVIQYEY